MLKKDWDARNVTTLVGLHACAAASNILPEQTLGRGLRRMYFGNDTPETVSVMGTPAFMAFVEGIQREGVELDQVPMGSGTRREDLLVVEVDTGDTDKDLAALDSALPRLARRWQREFQHLDKLDALAMACDPPPRRSSPSTRKKPERSSSKPCWKAPNTTPCCWTTPAWVMAAAWWPSSPGN